MTKLAWGVIVLIGVAFAAGLAAGWVFGARSVALVVGPLLGSGPNTAGKLPDWSDWQYPGSDSRGKHTGPAFEFKNETTNVARGFANCTACVTTDDFESVVRFYQARIKEVAQSESVVETVGVGAVGGGMTFDFDSKRGSEGSSWFHFDDSREPYQERGYAERPLRKVALGIRAMSFFVTVVITRAKEENETHVLLFTDYSGEKTEGK